MKDAASRAFLPTPLHARTAELCATNTWIEECGFTVPATYSSLPEEQDALTSRVVVSDLSARQSWLIEGPDASVFLARAIVGDVALAANRTLRTVWCDDAGFVRGEGLLARFSDTQFELATAVRDFAWFADGAQGFDVKVTNATGARAVIGVRGPLSSQLLAAAGLDAQSDAASLTRPEWRPAQVALLRDGAGEGIELWMHADDAVVVWDRLWRAGAGFGVAAAGAQALDALRIESGIAKPGADWQPAHLVRERTQLCVPRDLGFAPDLTRRFNGADALRRATGQGAQVLVQFAADEPLATGPLIMRGIEVGRITSHAWSESRAAASAIGWLDADAVKVGTKLSVPAAKGVAQAEIVRPLF